MSKNLILSRPMVAFDVETTGLDVQQDRIIEICCIKMHGDGGRDVFTRRFNPQIPIKAAASEVHGIVDADLQDKPLFVDVAAALFEFLRACDLTGFNIERFDLPLLQQEFGRVGLAFPAADVRVVDSWKIFLRQEPRDLSAAYKLYCGATLSGAHSAEADAHAAAEVLLAQVQRYGKLPATVDGLHDYCHAKNPKFVDAAGKVIWDGDEATLNFGKYRGHPLRALVQKDPDYLRWMVDAGAFAQDVKDVIAAALNGQLPLRPSNPAAPTPGVATVLQKETSLR